MAEETSNTKQHLPEEDLVLVDRVVSGAKEGSHAKMMAKEGMAGSHGNSGRKPTDAGRWMYPRAADLGSAEELFWIVKNGIRLGGMPAFGKVESDEHIWDLVHFVRTLPANPSPKGEGTTQ